MKIVKKEVIKGVEVGSVNFGECFIFENERWRREERKRNDQV